MNAIPSMDRHIQQTNDRLLCIKQVSVSCGVYGTWGLDASMHWHVVQVGGRSASRPLIGRLCLYKKCYIFNISHN